MVKVTYLKRSIRPEADTRGSSCTQLRGSQMSEVKCPEE